MATTTRRLKPRPLRHTPQPNGPVEGWVERADHPFDPETRAFIDAVHEQWKADAEADRRRREQQSDS